MAARSIYLQDIPMDEAWARLAASLQDAGLWAPLPGEEVLLSEALGRVTAAPVWAAVSAPHYHAAAMDGYAVRAQDTLGASPTAPITLNIIETYAEIEHALRPAMAVNTGHAMPPWADAVIMIEHVQAGAAPGELLIRTAAAPWQHVRPLGEDMVATELVLPANHVLRPVDLGAIAGGGHATVLVRRKPRVAILPTGSELVSVEDMSSGPLKPGQIIEFNSLMLAAQIEAWGGQPTRWPIIQDDPESLQDAIQAAAYRHDLVLVIAGSSAGSEDYTARAIAALGEVLVHGIAVRPGHPVIFGMVGVAGRPHPRLAALDSPSPLVERGSGGEATRTPQSGRLWGMLRPLARQKRKQPTPSEDHLWQALRNRQLAGLKFRRQHAIERFIVDFFCAEASAIIEVDGPIHQYTVKEDVIRQEYFKSLGLQVLRVSSEEVMQDLNAVLQRIAARIRPHPRLAALDSPSPPVERGSGGEARIPVIGVPGYPVSAALTGEIFIEPLLSRWLGRAPAEPPVIRATISRKVLSPAGDEEYLRVTVGQVGKRVIAAPLARGAGVISSLVRADGIVRIPRFSEGLDASSEVTVHLYRQPESIARTIVAIGSHDLTLDLLAQYLAERAPGMRLASANVGSLGGLLAINRGEAHLAGSHLLDPDTGEYNWAYIDQYLAGQDVVLVTLAHREQGLIVAPGNPLGIQGLSDLARPEVHFVNRQRGAGTRLLLDYELGRLGIKADQVQGYEREEVTHMAVAAAVVSGSAGCGLGVRAAAGALKLDFVPVGWERYDLVIPRTYYEGALLQPLLALLHDEAFRAEVAALPGYDVREMGFVVNRS